MRIHRTGRYVGTLSVAAAVMAAVGVGAPIAAAKPAPHQAPSKAHRVEHQHGGGLDDVDGPATTGKAKKPTAAQQRAVRALGNARARWTAYGTPATLRAETGALTKASKASPETVARDFIRDQRDLFGLSAQDVKQLVLELRDPAATGTTYLRFAQRDGDRAVYGTGLVVVLDKDNRVVHAGGAVAATPHAAVQPSLSAEDAISAAAAAVKSKSAGASVQVQSRKADGTRRTTARNVFALEALKKPAPVTAELITYAVPDQVARPAWLVRIEVAADGDYDVVIDGVTGTLLERHNRYSHSGAEGTVFTGTDPEDGARSVVDFGGWVTGRTTSGPNVNAYQDLTNDNTADAGDQPQTPDTPDPAYQHFNYAWANAWATATTPGTDLTTDRDATVTQLFYYTNWFHDYAYGLGFTETSRNFQGDDPVLAEADDGWTFGCTNDDGDAIRCVNNANFNTPGDGTSPRMQMYAGISGSRYTQRANNRDTVVHEYAHGITGRILANGNLGGGTQGRALGEGWSDAFATSINADPVYGEYNNGNNTTGIRTVAYDNSTYTYGSLCNVSSSGCQEHSDGEIWASTMWDQRVALIGKYGAAAGKARHEQLLMSGIKATANSPTFLDARDGILSADNTVYGNADRCLLRRVFAGRGMGTDASTTGSTDMAPVAGTATPAECTPVAKPGGPYTTVEGADKALDGSASETKGDSGDSLSYAWDLDNDGQYDDATGATPSFTRVGQDGVFTVGVQVTNTAGYSATASTTVTVTNVEPSISIGSDSPRNEGALVTVTGTVSDPGWLDGLTGTINWGDGTPTAALSGVLENVRPDASLPYSNTHYYGDNGSYTVTVCADDDDPPTTCTTTPVQIDNVDPTLTIDPASITAFQEGDTAQVRATFTDPGWLDTYTGTIDYDNGAGAQPATTTVTTQGGPGVPDSGEVTGSLTYGDNGTYTLTVSVSDDDGGTDSASYPITVHNVNPTVTIDETGAVDVNGVKTLFADVNQPIDFKARVTDPGSDDLTLSWNWDDGTGPHANPISLVNPPNADPAHSPSVQPRDITQTTAHAFPKACLYDVVASAVDDDLGVGSDTVKVIITGSPTLSRGAGYWQKQYSLVGVQTFTAEQLQCYLDIARHMSKVFDEIRDASTIAKAYNDIFVAGLNGDMTEQLDRQLLTAWVNFANGGVEYGELLDSDGNKTLDKSFVNIMKTAEQVRANPASTKKQLQAQRDILTRINQRDGL